MTATADVLDAFSCNGVAEVRVSGGAVLVVLTGRLTSACCTDLRTLLLRARPAGVPDMHLDAAGVTAVDDAVFAVLLAASAWLHATGGHLFFIAQSASMRRSLHALGVASLLPSLPAVSTVPAQRRPSAALLLR